MTHKKERGPPTEPMLPEISGEEASVNLQEIHEAVAKARGHAAQWLAHRETMAKLVAKYEASTSTRSPLTGSNVVASTPPEKE